MACKECWGSITYTEKERAGFCTYDCQIAFYARELARNIEMKNIRVKGLAALNRALWNAGR